MSRELFVLRHCKSDWDNAIRQDEFRPLSPRGEKNAELLSNWMSGESLSPELVLCSTAVRARQTLELVNKSLQIPENRIQFLAGLYLASLKTLLQFLSEVDISYKSVLIVGHNPGLDYLVENISRNKPPRTGSGKLMTTGCLAHFECSDNWQTLTHNGNLLSITRPADIIEHRR